jgi:deoxyribose-phosphate aldolase
MRRGKMENILAKIDHSRLKPTVTEIDVIESAKATMKYGFASLCVLPKHVYVASSILPSSKLCAVIGFPLSDVNTDGKLYEIENCLKNGAGEFDIVLDISAVKEGNFKKVDEELFKIRKETSGNVIKLILECCYLTDEEKRQACQIAIENGWDFVKTSTGFGKYGATKEDVELLKNCSKGRINIKAAGGIRTLSQARMFIEIGADRIGTSSGEEIAYEYMHSR